jgi:small subunit ribosomal protein S6
MAETKKTTRKKKVATGSTAATGITGGDRKYEAMFLFPPPGVTDLDGMIANARGIVERHGGKILVIKRWDERKLAYEIRKQKRGTYIIAFYEGPGSSVAAIERDVNLSEDVLRVLVTSADHLSQSEMEKVEPQPIQPREERAPWDRPDFNRPMRGGDRGDRPRREEHAAPAEAEAEAVHE